MINDEFFLFSGNCIHRLSFIIHHYPQPLFENNKHQMKNNPTPFRQRIYLPNEFKITVWSKMRPYFHELLRRDIQSVEELEKWISDQNELTQVIQDEFDLRRNNHFIHQTKDERAINLITNSQFNKILCTKERK